MVKLIEHRLSQSTLTNDLWTAEKLRIIEKSFEKQNGRVLALVEWSVHLISVMVWRGVTCDANILLVFLETGDEINQENY